jgi:uncharacterized protein YecE (DUF72 family)
MTKGIARIGTSNVHIPGNKSTFPEEYRLRSRLHYYSAIFNTVELNSCFYKTPQATTYEKWAADTPPDFQFTLKMSRDVTHAKELRGDLACMDRFLEAAGSVGNKKGCLLIQFPGKITIDYFNQAGQILERLNKMDAAGEWRKAVEFRNKSWYIAETFELLDEYHSAIVLNDHPKGRIEEPSTNANFVYLRFHGPGGNYRDSYSDRFLEQKACEVINYMKEGKNVYVYFNNTIGDAFNNAKTLRSGIVDYK